MFCVEKLYQFHALNSKVPYDTSNGLVKLVVHFFMALRNLGVKRHFCGSLTVMVLVATKEDEVSVKMVESASNSPPKMSTKEPTKRAHPALPSFTATKDLTRASQTEN